jgi:hypothetical protein
MSLCIGSSSRGRDGRNDSAIRISLGHGYLMVSRFLSEGIIESKGLTDFMVSCDTILIYGDNVVSPSVERANPPSQVVKLSSACFRPKLDAK